MDLEEFAGASPSSEMKGEDYIDKSPWPFNWKESVETSLKNMAALHKVQEKVAADQFFSGFNHKAVLAQPQKFQNQPRAVTRSPLKILVVSVCEYQGCYEQHLQGGFPKFFLVPLRARNLHSKDGSTVPENSTI